MKHPVEWEHIKDPCPSANPATAGLCSKRSHDTPEGRRADPVHYHDVWDYDPETGEGFITGFTEWEDPA